MNDISTICILETLELERKRISMELHDTTVQSLTNLIHKTEFVTKLMDIDLVCAKLELNTMNEIIRNSINELREIIYELRPMAIDDLGLVLSLEQHIKQIENENEFLNINLNVINEENVDILPVVNLTLFRVIQEALINVIKHAKGDRVDIYISYEQNEILITIEDDGIGFSVADVEKDKRHYGLSIMQERIDMLSGSMCIKSERGKGTMIIIKVPIIKEGKDETNKHSYY